MSSISWSYDCDLGTDAENGMCQTIQEGFDYYSVINDEIVHINQSLHNLFAVFFGFTLCLGILIFLILLWELLIKSVFTR